MTLEEARQIREAFGPCTVVYEAMTIEEIVKDAADMTDREWVEIMVQVEEVDGERSHEWMEQEHDHSLALRGHQEHMKKLRERLAPFMRRP